MKIFLAMIFLSLNGFTDCVEEKLVKGSDISYIDGTSYIEYEPGRYQKLGPTLKLHDSKIYKVQVNQQISKKTYNKRYLEYYTYEHLLKFLEENRENFEKLGYQIKPIGQSIEKRNLFSVTPSSMDKAKKTVIMFGRHHGDEGTANWIIEGFLRKLFLEDNAQWFEKNQLVLYPMINPDGANARTRYNSNGYDLNRKWSNTRGPD